MSENTHWIHRRAGTGLAAVLDDYAPNEDAPREVPNALDEAQGESIEGI